MLGINESKKRLDLKDVSTNKLIMELSTREGLMEILAVKGEQYFKVKIGATLYEFEGPAKLIIIGES